MIWGFEQGDVVVQIGKPDKYVVMSRRYGVSMDGHIWQEYTLKALTRGHLYLEKSCVDKDFVKVGDWDFLHDREVDDDI